MRVPFLVLPLVLLAAMGVHAEDEPNGRIDLPAFVVPLESGLERLKTSPRYRGHAGVLTKAWRDHVKRRIGRMRRRVQDLESKRNWVPEPESHLVRGLAPEKWSPFVRNLAGLHTELGACAEGYDAMRVDGRAALRRWVKANPGPLPIWRVPARDSLDDIDLTIRRLQAQGLVVPISMWDSRRRLATLVVEQELAAREERRIEYEEARRNAEAFIAEEVEITRGELTGFRQAFEDGQRVLRELLAASQKIEEQRLTDMLDALDLDEQHREEQTRRIAKMRESRDATLGFSDARLSRYLAGIQQGWMLPRSKLLALIAKARKATAK